MFQKWNAAASLTIHEPLDVIMFSDFEEPGILTMNPDEQATVKPSKHSWLRAPFMTDRERLASLYGRDTREVAGAIFIGNMARSGLAPICVACDRLFVRNPHHRCRDQKLDDPTHRSDHQHYGRFRMAGRKRA